MRASPDRQVLTQKAVEKLPVLKKRAHYYDKDIRGFGVRVEPKPSGRKSFFFFVKAHGKPQFRSLGQFPDINVSEARTAAKLWAGKLSNWKLRGYEGPSPFEKEKKEHAPTFRELVDAYIEGQVKVEANRPEHAERNVRWMVKKYFSEWTGKRIDAIGIEDVLAIRKSVGKKHYLANRLVEFVRALYNWSAGKPNGKVNFWFVENPAAHIELHDEKPRERFLQPDELIRFNDCLKDEPSGDLRDFLVLALTTGARKSDIFSMRWRDIQWERLTWRVPYPKNGESYHVSLLPAALEVLERRRGQVPDSCEYVFPSHGRSGHVTDLKKRWEQFRKRAAIPDIRVHDIRRSAGSYLAMANVSMKQIAEALGHRSLQSTEIYARLSDQAVRDAREAGAAKMQEMMLAAKKRTRKQNLLAAVARG